MTPGLTTIIIPTYNHAAFLADAVAAALAQTAPVEVIVVDDGSTDGPGVALLPFREDPRLRVLRIEHAGPSAARNRGLDEAAGEFVMFLDADDVIDPEKVALQRAVLAADKRLGWVTCDVVLEGKTGTKLASDFYAYSNRFGRGWWIAPELAVANFIPIMSPLIRASVLEGIRFTDDEPHEDWGFWRKVGDVARVAYLPRVLATYRHRPGGHKSKAKARGRRVPPAPPAPAPADVPSIADELVPPLRLNLGCGTPGAASWHPIPGFVNLDKSLGWRFEDGLGQYADGSVAGITVSHSLMYVHVDRWAYVFGEFARVLQPGGVVRITEDDTAHPDSSRRGGWKGSAPAVTLTSAALVKAALEAAGLEAFDVSALTTYYVDESLRQAQHGEVPDVFFVEGIKR